jgi:hypothetical protein
LIADREGAFFIYKHEILKFTMPIFTSVVCWAGISGIFNRAVCGTRDRALLLCRLNKGYLTRTAELRERRPSMVLITKAWR